MKSAGRNVELKRIIMNIHFVTLFILLSLEMHFVRPSHDEFYCKVDEGNYEICRKCPTLEEKCETPLENEKCQCDNIRFTNGSMIFKLCTIG